MPFRAFFPDGYLQAQQLTIHLSVTDPQHNFKYSDLVALEYVRLYPAGPTKLKLR